MINKITNIFISTLIVVLIVLVFVTTIVNSDEKYYIIADCKGKDIEIVLKIPYAELFYNLNIQDTVVDTCSLLTESKYYYYLTKRSEPTKKYDKDVYDLKSFRCLR